MSRMTKFSAVLAVPALLLGPQVATAAEDGPYVAAAGSWNFLKDSSNSGALTSDITTGQGTTIPFGTPLPAGSDLGWETEMDDGFGGLLAVGARLNEMLRVEGEFGYRTNDVSSHSGVTVAGINIDGEDAAILLGSPDPIGATVGDVVADGQGKMSSWSVMGNVYADFGLSDGSVKPFLGVGAGMARIKTTFDPSGVDILSDSSWEFAWQLIGGVSFDVGENIELYTSYRYFRAGSPDNTVDLLPATLSTKYRIHALDIGLRFFM